MEHFIFLILKLFETSGMKYTQLRIRIKADIHYFLSNDSPSKTMKNVFYFI